MIADGAARRPYQCRVGQKRGGSYDFFLPDDVFVIPAIANGEGRRLIHRNRLTMFARKNRM